MPHTTLISPSILSADFSRLGEEVRAIDDAGADWIHIDVMDGHFVPNISIGPAVVKALRPHTNKTFDVHLMIAPCDPYLDVLVAGSAVFKGGTEQHYRRNIDALRAAAHRATNAA